MTASAFAVDRPEVVAEVAAAFARYEDALRRADALVLDELFWSDDRVVRFGAGEEILDRRALCAFNAQRPQIPDRHLTLTRITTFGDDLAVVSALFGEAGPGRVGRQSQTWVRIDGTWRVVAAHVSVVDHPGHE